jgi:hypothetical protein
MYFSLGQAAKETGKSKSVIYNALKSGRMSGRHNDKGEWEIDPAELFRVFSPQNGQEPRSERNSTYQNGLLELLQEQLHEAKERERQAHEREQQAQEREARLLVMLETEQAARRVLETKLLPAPKPALVGKIRAWILLAMLAAALVFAGWYFRAVIVSVLAS